MTSVERIKDYCNLKPEEDPDLEFKAISDEWPRKGSVRVKNVSLKYDEQLPYALESINFSIEPGQKV